MINNPTLKRFVIIGSIFTGSWSISDIIVKPPFNYIWIGVLIFIFCSCVTNKTSNIRDRHKKEKADKLKKKELYELDFEKDFEGYFYKIDIDN